MRTLARDEKGAALLLAIILLLVGGLIAAPLLAHMGTGILTGEVYETRTAELYAADAGVEDAVWKIQHQDQIPEVKNLYCGGGNDTWSYNMTSNTTKVNGKSVAVNITWANNTTNGATYEITSSAASNNSGTTVKSYVDAEFVVENLLDNAITSQGDIGLGNKWTTVNGDVQYGGSLTGQGSVNGTPKPHAYGNWPDSTTLSNYYKSEVQSQNATDPGESIYINQLNPHTIGPSYRHGDLDIYNKDNPATLTLNGTVYVDGDLTFHEPGSNNYTINLMGHTIFATGKITFPPVSQGKTPHVSIIGSGCIIAIENIDFYPSISSSSTDFVFVMSIESYIDFKPNGTFYGSLAGDLVVDLQSNCKMTWTPWQGRGLTLPDFAYRSDVVKTVTVRTWEVNPR